MLLRRYTSYKACISAHKHHLEHWVLDWPCLAAPLTFSAMKMRIVAAAMLGSLVAACGFKLEQSPADEPIQPGNEASALDAATLPGGDANSAQSDTSGMATDDAATQEDAVDDAGMLLPSPAAPYANALSVHQLRCNAVVMSAKAVIATRNRVDFQFRQSGSTLALYDAIHACARSLALGCGSPDPSCDFDTVPGLGAYDAPCEFATQCLSGACTASGNSCGRCIAPLALGESCAASPAACGSEATCESGLCVARTYKAAGASCGLQGETCAQGLICDSSAHCTKGRAIGESCASDNDCDELGTVYCSERSVCSPRPGLNEFCGQTACAAGLVCGAETMLCRAAQAGIPTGLGCTAPDSCETGSSCRTAGGWSACLPLTSAGQSCSSDADCDGDDTVCASGVCGALVSHCTQ